MAEARDKFGNVISQGVRIPGKVIRSPIPTDAGSAYAAGELIGAKIELASVLDVNSGETTLQNVILTDLAQQNVEGDILFFSSDPTSTAFDNNAAFVLDSNDLDKVCARVNVSSLDYLDLASNSIYQPAVIPEKFMDGTSGTSLWACLISNAVVTYVGSADLNLQTYFTRN